MINLRKETEYAIQFIQYLQQNSAKYCSLQFFAEKSGISFYFMQKIARKLYRNKIINSGQGVHGGYKLNNKKLNLHQVVEIMENGVNLLPCVRDEKACACSCKAKSCNVRLMMCKLNKEIVKLMQKIKIT